MDQLDTSYLKEICAILKDYGVTEFECGGLRLSFRKDPEPDDSANNPVSPTNVGFEVKGTALDDEEEDEDLDNLHARLFKGRLPTLSPKKST